MRRAVCSLVFVAWSSVGAQQIPATSLPAANAVHPHEFSGITSLRELSDGRVIVTDGREQRLLVLDFRTGTSREIGRTGRGPNEYSMIAQVFAVGGDSIPVRKIAVDARERRAYESRISGPQPQVPTGFEMPPAEYPRFVRPSHLIRGLWRGRADCCSCAAPRVLTSRR